MLRFTSARSLPPRATISTGLSFRSSDPTLLSAAAGPLQIPIEARSPSGTSRDNGPDRWWHLRCKSGTTRAEQWRAASSSRVRDQESHDGEGGGNVKKVEAVIKPFRIDAVKEALIDAGVTGLTFSEVKGVGRQKGHTELYRGAEYQVDLVPKVKVELVVPDELVSRVMRALQHAARTGTMGDGKIFVLPVEETLRVRTGERGESAL
jgi:nitrogen regulatory protein P-II 1